MTDYEIDYALAAGMEDDPDAALTAPRDMQAKTTGHGIPVTSPYRAYPSTSLR
jgi:hypothetical protein